MADVRRHSAQSGIGGRHTGEGGEARCGVRTLLLGGSGGNHDQSHCHQGHDHAGGGPSDDPGSRAVAATRFSALPVRRPDRMPSAPDSDGWRQRRSSGEIHPRKPLPSRSSALVIGIVSRCAPVVSVHGPEVTEDGLRGTSPDRRMTGGGRSPAHSAARQGWPYDDRVARDLAIDLGTANTLVYARGRGIVLNQPTVIALNTRTHEVLAVGNEAWKMIGRTPGYIVAVRPLREGAITDFDITERMIRLLLRRAGVTKLNRPRVLICVSVGDHLGGASGGEGGRTAGGRVGRPSDRAAHGCGHRCRSGHPRTGRATWWSTSVVAPPRRR